MITKETLLQEIVLVIDDYEMKSVTASSKQKLLYDQMLDELRETKQVLENESFVMTVRFSNDHELVRIVAGEQPEFVDADGVVKDNSASWDWTNIFHERKVYGLWWHDEKRTTVW